MTLERKSLHAQGTMLVLVERTKGIDKNNTIIDTHGMMGIHMPPYYNAIIRGVSTIMLSYSSWNGVKTHANSFLVTDYLKNKLKFRVGFFSLLRLKLKSSSWHVLSSLC